MPDGNDMTRSQKQMAEYLRYAMMNPNFLFPVVQTQGGGESPLQDVAAFKNIANSADANRQMRDARGWVYNSGYNANSIYPPVAQFSNGQVVNPTITVGNTTTPASQAMPGANLTYTGTGLDNLFTVGYADPNNSYEKGVTPAPTNYLGNANQSDLSGISGGGTLDVPKETGVVNGAQESVVPKIDSNVIGVSGMENATVPTGPSGLGDLFKTAQMANLMGNIGGGFGVLGGNSPGNTQSNTQNNPQAQLAQQTANVNNQATQMGEAANQAAAAKAQKTAGDNSNFPQPVSSTAAGASDTGTTTQPQQTNLFNMPESSQVAVDTSTLQPPTKPEEWVLDHNYDKDVVEQQMIKQGIKNPFIRDFFYDRDIAPMRAQAHENILTNLFKQYLDPNATDEQKKQAMAGMALEMKNPFFADDRQMLVDKFNNEIENNKMRRELEKSQIYKNMLTGSTGGKNGGAGSITAAMADFEGQPFDVEGVGTGCVYYPSLAYAKAGVIGWKHVVSTDGIIANAKRYEEAGFHVLHDPDDGYQLKPGDILIGDGGTGEKDGHAVMYMGNGQYMQAGNNNGKRNVYYSDSSGLRSVYKIFAGSELPRRGSGLTAKSLGLTNSSKNSSKVSPDGFTDKQRVAFTNSANAYIDASDAAMGSDDPKVIGKADKAMKKFVTQLAPMTKNVWANADKFDNDPSKAGFAIYQHINDNYNFDSGMSPIKLASAIACAMKYNSGVMADTDEIRDGILHWANAGGTPNTTNGYGPLIDNGYNNGPIGSKGDMGNDTLTPGQKGEDTKSDTSQDDGSSNTGDNSGSTDTDPNDPGNQPRPSGGPTTQTLGVVKDASSMPDAADIKNVMAGIASWFAPRSDEEKINDYVEQEDRINKIKSLFHQPTEEETLDKYLQQ